MEFLLISALKHVVSETINKWLNIRDFERISYR
jgi:hypothetical protein